MLKHVVLCVMGVLVVGLPGMALAQPPVLDGLELHFDATTLALNEGDPVTDWLDTSGNNRHASGGNGGATFGEVLSEDGVPVVTFHGDYAEALAFDYDPNGKDMTVIGYALTTSTSGGWPNFHSGYIGWGESGGHGLVSPSGFFEEQTFIMMGGEEGIRGFTLSIPHIPVIKHWTINVARLDSAAGVVEAFREGELLGSSDATEPIMRAMSQGHIAGINFADGIGWDGSLAEVMVYSRALTDEELGLVQDYLDAKWTFPAAPEAEVSNAVEIDVTDGVDITVEASSQINEGEGFLKAVDNDVATKWLTAWTSDGWLKVSIPEAKAINGYSITSANDAPNRDPNTWTLEGSNDGETWVVLDAQAGQTWENRFERRVFTIANDVAYSMYKLDVTVNNSDGLMGFAEMELLQIAYRDEVDATDAGATVTASSQINEGEGYAKTIDNDVATKWLTAWTSTGWIQVDLGAGNAKAVNGLAITSANDAPNRDPNTWTLLGSNDGENWDVLDEQAGQSWENRFERRVFDFDNDTAYQMYKLDVTANNGDGLMGFSELELLMVSYSQMIDWTDADGEVSASSQIHDGEGFAKAFDNNVATKWLTGWTSTGWIQYDFGAGNAHVVNLYTITSANDAPNRDPKDWILMGSNDGGVTWDLVDIQFDQLWDERFQTREFAIENSTAYQMYKLDVSANNGDGLMGFAEMELIEVKPYELP